MREQKGYLFHRYESWFLRYCDDVKQPDGTIKRKLVCKKLEVKYGGKYRTKASIQEFVDKILKPVNSGTSILTAHRRCPSLSRRFICRSTSKKIFAR